MRTQEEKIEILDEITNCLEEVLIQLDMLEEFEDVEVDLEDLGQRVNSIISEIDILR